MSVYRQQVEELSRRPRVWAVTGVAGFIGSNLLERLLQAGQRVVGLDSFATGHRRNLSDVEERVGSERWTNFRLIEGDTRDSGACLELLEGVDLVLHQAALGSVPLSLEHPDRTHEVNVTGFLNILLASRQQRVQRVVYASSCAVYGDDVSSPKVEQRLGNSISPYATSKRVNELYADVFGRCFGLETIGLRYFNVYGRRQDPDGAYAAVIPKWVTGLIRGEPICINGDGETSRDFVHVADVTQANILAATTMNPGAVNRIFNVGSGTQVSLNQLFGSIRGAVSIHLPDVAGAQPVYGDFRPGDIRFSLADVSAARELLSFGPEYGLEQGLAEALDWYTSNSEPCAAGH